MKPSKVNILGMYLDEWKVDSCIAHFGIGDNWATLYDIESESPNNGHATTLLAEAKCFYEKSGKKVGGSVALNPAMKKIYKKLGYIEYA